jgi:hypothetical protein
MVASDGSRGRSQGLGESPGWFWRTAEADGKQEASCPLAADGGLPLSDNVCDQSHLARLYVHTERWLHRCPTGSANGDASGISRGSLSRTAGGLIGASQLLAGGDTGGDLVDASRYLLLTSSGPVDALPHCVEVAQHRVECDHIGSFLRSYRATRGQPAKLRI